MNTLAEFETNVIDWSTERGIIPNSTAVIQTLKCMSELGELADNIAKGKCIKDDIGDVMVTLVNIAYLSETNLMECADKAWLDIKDRKGFLNKEGIFIKETDAAYEQMLMDFEETKEPTVTNFKWAADHDFTGRYINILCILSDGETDRLKFRTYTVSFNLAPSLNQMKGQPLSRVAAFLSTVGEVE